MKVPNGTDIYLKFGSRIKIPVNPEEISITYPSKNQTYEILNSGEVVVPMPPGLTEVSFSSFIPEYDALLAATSLGDVKEVAASVGIDVADVEFWRSSIRVLEGMIEEMEELV